MTSHEVAIVPKGLSFSHTEACRVFDVAMRCRTATMVVVDLKYADDATTSAFARLVLLRRRLLDTGRDLRLAGLRARAADVYKVNRLTIVLPTREADALRASPAGNRTAKAAQTRGAPVSRPRAMLSSVASV